MISLRYHAVSIAAVFLALAVGVVLGSSGVSDRVLAAVSTQRDDLGAQVTRLTAERDALAAQERAADEFAARVGPGRRARAAGRARPWRSSSPAPTPQDRDAVAGLVGQAGGTVTGQVELTDAVGDPARADQLRELTSQLLPTGAQLPAASDTGSLVGRPARRGAAGPRRAAPVEPRRRRLRAHRAHQRRLRPPRATPRARRTSCWCSPAGAQAGVDAADAAAVYARLAAQLDLAGAGAVLAGRTARRTPPARSASRVRTRRSSARLSTVDDVQSGSGRVAAVLALHEQLDGRAGSYGTGAGATDGAAPASAPTPAA